MKNLLTVLILGLLPVSLNAKTIKVAVVDTGFDFKSSWNPSVEFVNDNPSLPIPRTPKLCKTGHKDYTDTGIQDDHGHGTHIAGLIGQYAGDADYCLVIYKFYTEKQSSTKNTLNTLRAFKDAIAESVDIINYSGGGIAKNDMECTILKGALDKGIKVVAAAGNEQSDLDTLPFYPALCDDRIVKVSGVDGFGERIPCSNYSTKKYSLVKELGNNVLSILPDGKWGYMTGTSQATAITSGKLVQKLYKLQNLDNLYIPNILKSRALMLASNMQCIKARGR